MIPSRFIYLHEGGFICWYCLNHFVGQYPQEVHAFREEGVYFVARICFKSAMAYIR